MPFFPISLAFSYEIVINDKSKQTSARSDSSKHKRKGQRHASSTRRPPPIQRRPSADPREQSLSPDTQHLQQRIRAEMTEKRAARLDADSLLLLEAVAASERRREQRLDAQSLEVLLCATARAQGDDRILNKESCERSDSWSSFDDLAVNTPSPSPRLRGSVRDDAEQEAGLTAWSKSGEKGFEESMTEERRRRGASQIIQGSAQAPYAGQQSVAELMKWFEELREHDEISDGEGEEAAV